MKAVRWERGISFVFDGSQRAMPDAFCILYSGGRVGQEIFMEDTNVYPHLVGRHWPSFLFECICFSGGSIERRPAEKF